MSDKSVYDMGTIYVRWQLGEDRVGKEYSPLPPDHPAYNLPCVGCWEPLGNGEPILLIVIGPGNDPEARRKHSNGQWYNAVAWCVHKPCARGE